MPFCAVCVNDQTKLQDEESKTDESALKPAAKDGNAPRFEIKKWNAVAMWSWDICADTVRRGVGGSFNGCVWTSGMTHTRGNGRLFVSSLIISPL
jgi:hypothetical protein